MTHKSSEKELQYAKAYYEKNKDTILEQVRKNAKKKVKCECGHTVSSYYLKHHHKSLRHQEIMEAMSARKQPPAETVQQGGNDDFNDLKKRAVEILEALQKLKNQWIKNEELRQENHILRESLDGYYKQLLKWDVENERYIM